jgi:hypothetical protein
MKRMIPIFAVLTLASCTATSPQYVAQKQTEVLASAQAACSQVDAVQKRMVCLNRAVHHSGYWGEGVTVVAANDGSLRLVDNYQARALLENVGGDMYNSGANPGSAR